MLYYKINNDLLVKYSGSKYEPEDLFLVYKNINLFDKIERLYEKDNDYLKNLNFLTVYTDYFKLNGLDKNIIRDFDSIIMNCVLGKNNNEILKRIIKNEKIENKFLKIFIDVFNNGIFEINSCVDCYGVFKTLEIKNNKYNILKSVDLGELINIVKNGGKFYYFIILSWGGGFSDSRPRSLKLIKNDNYKKLDVVYVKTASSNGGGCGFDYYIIEAEI